MTQQPLDWHTDDPPVTLPPLMAPSGDESEQTLSRLRVYDVLKAAGDTGLSTPQLIERSRCYAAPRRVWELSRYYGYRIVGAKLQQNAWHWTLCGSEPWARPPWMPWRQAKQLEHERLKALGTAGNAPTGAVRQGR